MCIKIGDNELDTVKALMSMSLNAIISDVFELDLDDINASLRLREDLSMTAQQQEDLLSSIAEYFDDIEVDLNQISTLNDLFELIIFSEFK